MSDERIAAGIKSLDIELPSWAFGNSGTRFKVFAQPGVPRDPFEKIADAAQVHALTGAAPRVALHISAPWSASALAAGFQAGRQFSGVDSPFGRRESAASPHVSRPRLESRRDRVRPLKTSSIGRASPSALGNAASTLVMKDRPWAS